MTTAVLRRMFGWSLKRSEKTRESATHSRTVELTGGDEEKVPWVVVYTAANRTEAEIVRARLASEQIPAILHGEALGVIYGLTTGPLAQVHVLVPEPLAERARSLLEPS